MFLPEAVVWAIHRARVRDIERAARDRRLLDGSADTTRPTILPSANVLRDAPATRPACGDSAGQPA